MSPTPQEIAAAAALGVGPAKNPAPATAAAAPPPAPTADNDDWLRDLNAEDLQTSMDKVDEAIPKPDLAKLVDATGDLRERLMTARTWADVGKLVAQYTKAVGSAFV